MAIALVILAIGSVAAGWIGIPHALGGHNQLGAWLEPAFEVPHVPGTEVAGATGALGAPGAMSAPGAEGALGAAGATGASGLAALTMAAPCEPGSPDTKTAGGALAGMAIAPCEATPAEAAQATTVAALPAGATFDAPVAAGLQTGRPADGTAQTVVSTQAAASAQAPATQPGAEAAAAESHGSEQLELMLMGVSSLIAFLGIGLATWLWLKNPATVYSIAATFPGLHRLLLNKYYVDEFYDVTVVQPVKIVSEDGLWRVMDARLVDGAVNGAGQVVGAMSAVFRLFQTGSVKTYAASTFLGVVAILAYYLWR
jgi:NADH:ubiquinone oxidoreductase subunit 5 (subunit L)/multisubunit Na+/H+ antiporter MnhA subunit